MSKKVARRGITLFVRLGSMIAIAVISSAAGVAFAQTPTPTPDICGPNYPANSPTPYPPLNPPAEAETTQPLPAFSGTIRTVNGVADLQAAVDAAQPGDRIQLTGGINETFSLTKSGLLIEAAPGFNVAWFGQASQPDMNGFFQVSPALIIASSVSVVLKGMTFRGYDGWSDPSGPSGILGRSGGSGASGIVVGSGSEVTLIDCHAQGGDGGDGERTDTCNGGARNGPGGSGGSGVRINGSNSIVRADLDCSFVGGGAGRSSAPTAFFFGVCCSFAEPHGAAGQPVREVTAGQFQWAELIALTPTPSPTPTDTPMPSPTGCGPNSPPSPTPYPVFTAPPAAQITTSLDGFAGTVRTVFNGAELQAAVDAAAPGDRIQIAASITKTLTLTKSGLMFIAAAEGTTWIGETGPHDFLGEFDGQPALILDAPVEVTLSGLTVRGAMGWSGGFMGLLGRDGHNGAQGILIQAAATVNLVDCQVLGANGGSGEPLDIPGMHGSGGNGAAAIRAITGSNAVVHADLECTFKGGNAGPAGSTIPFGQPPDCILAGFHGIPAPPVSISGSNVFLWAQFLAGTETPTPVPTRDNPAADFDNSGCTDIIDFLFLLDNWQTVPPIGPPELGIGDFLLLLDNWQVGTNCA